MHFAIALAVAAIYILASRRVAVLRTQWVLLGLLYGSAVWAVMNLLVLPLTAVAPGSIMTVALVDGVIGHALFVGLPSAFFAKKVPVAQQALPVETLHDDWSTFQNRSRKMRFREKIWGRPLKNRAHSLLRHRMS